MATTTSDAAGRFSLNVPPGQYGITATDTSYRFQAGRQVTGAGPTRCVRSRHD
jgi:hypothetical protein